ncbi:hypothetical protein VST7929_01396 [Vibrio stylophorae]|uniref:Uncharacterized protein n=1 Tax=Vibrio stylophorae TaxID=659351 RepID=A0ABM8ZTA1_9VIBR|nr:hypothetical protein VST7929_01396 [Vibrio stylophorae]
MGIHGFSCLLFAILMDLFTKKNHLQVVAMTLFVVLCVLFIDLLKQRL